MSNYKENLYTIKEINQISKREKLSKAFQSYASIYNLVKVTLAIFVSRISFGIRRGKKNDTR